MHSAPSSPVLLDHVQPPAWIPRLLPQSGSSPSTLVLLPLLLSLPILYGLTSFARSGGPKQWARAYASVAVLLPFFAPSRAAARGLAVTIAGIIACLAASRAFIVMSPLLLRRVVDSLSLIAREDAGAVGGSVETPTTTLLDAASESPWKGIVAYVLVTHLLRGMVRDFQTLLESRLYNDVCDRIAAEAFSRVLALGSEYHEGEGRGKAASSSPSSSSPSSSARLSRGPGDGADIVCNTPGSAVRFVQSVVFEAVPMAVDLLLAVFAFWRVSGGLVAFTMASMLGVYLFAQTQGEDTRKKFPAMRDTRAQRFHVPRDALNNWSTVALFGREQHEVDRFLAAAANARTAYEDWRYKRGFLRGSRVALTVGLIVLGLMASWQIREGSRRVGDFVMLMQYWAELVYSTDGYMRLFTHVDEFVSDSEKLVDILSRQPVVADADDATDLRIDDGSIEFDNVSFSYPGAKGPALDGVSFSIRGGQTVAIVGETGGGKSTLLKLLCRTHDCSSGVVRVDGQDLRTVRRASLLAAMAVVPQLVGILRASVLDNIRYGRLEASDAEVEAACRAACLHDKIVRAFAAGYNEQVGGTGTTSLSGGEAQRLAIARALLRDAPIVVLDEAMGSLDSETEWKIQNHLREWCKGRTVVIVAHRLATIAHADLILAVKDGRIVESGTQEELLAREDGYYRSLWTKQKL